MGFYRPPPKRETQENPKKKKTPQSFKTEFEKFEENYFRENPPPITPAAANNLQPRIKKSDFQIFLLLRIIAKMFMRRKKKIGLIRKYSCLHSKANPKRVYKAKKREISEALKRYEENPAIAGNIPYKNLVKAQGENYRIRVSLSAVPKLYAYPFFFSARLYKDYALVSIKAKDKELLQRALGVEDISVLEKHNSHYSPKAEYFELKKRAEQLGVKVEFLEIQPEQLEQLKDKKDRFVAIPTKTEKIRLAFLPQNKDYILHSLYPDKYKSETDILFSVGRNSKVNTRLKSEALLGGKQIRYRILSKEEVEHLAESIGEDRFAVFSKNAQGENLNGQYNVVFKEDDTEEIETALKNPRTTKRKI